MQVLKGVCRLFALFAGFGLVVGCFGSEKSGASDEEGATKTAKQAVKEGSAQGSPGESNEESAPTPKRKPGWEIEVTGDIQTEASGQSVLRKYASNAANTEQIVLAGTPFGDKSGSGRMTFTLKGLPNQGPSTYTARRSVATFDNEGVSCRLATGEGEKPTNLRVDVTRDSENVFQGNFKGTLKCDPAKEGEEPRFVDVSGKFLDY